MATVDEDIKAEEERVLKERRKYTDEEWYKNILDDLNNWQKVRINIGVIGQAKQGKSSLINALLGFEFDDDGELPPEAAKIDESGVCTRKARPFVYPGKENLVLWDLPGIDGTDHKIDKYLEIIGADHPEVDPSKRRVHYDFFLLVVSDVIGTDADFLISKARKLGQKFYLVRTHIDETIRKGEVRKRSAEDVKIDVRDSLIEQISKLPGGFCLDIDYKLFLVNNNKQSEHDFEELQKSLIEECPQEKHEALVRCMRGSGLKLIEHKFSVLKNRVSTVARSCFWRALVPSSFHFVSQSRDLILAEILGYFKMFELFSEDVEAFEKKHSLEGGSLETFVRNKLEKESSELSTFRKNTKALSKFSVDEDLLKVIDITSSSTALKDAVGDAADFLHSSSFKRLAVVGGIAALILVAIGVNGYYGASQELHKNLDILRKVAVAKNQQASDLIIKNRSELRESIAAPYNHNTLSI